MEPIKEFDEGRLEGWVRGVERAILFRERPSYGVFESGSIQFGRDSTRRREWMIRSFGPLTQIRTRSGFSHLSLTLVN